MDGNETKKSIGVQAFVVDSQDNIIDHLGFVADVQEKGIDEVIRRMYNAFSTYILYRPAPYWQCKIMFIHPELKGHEYVPWKDEFTPISNSYLTTALVSWDGYIENLLNKD